MPSFQQLQRYVSDFAGVSPSRIHTLRRKPARSPVGAALENLESRCLLSATATLVKVLNPNLPDGSSTSEPIVIGSELYFTTNDGVHGNELWESDGTSVGTVLLKDINPGSGYSNPVQLTNVNGTLFFAADDGVNGMGLWKSDGTNAGTVLVKTLHFGSIGSYTTWLDVNGTLYFTTDDGSQGVDLWKSDGTSAGTVVIQDVSPGSQSYQAVPRFLANVNGTLFFTAAGANSNEELWKSDGTTSGTVLVKAINSASRGYNQYLSLLTNGNGTLYFMSHSNQPGGDAFWKSDGTDAGTVIVKDQFFLGVGSGPPEVLTNFNGLLYFGGYDEVTQEVGLYQSDGTTAGTQLVQSANLGIYSQYEALTPFPVEQTLYFNASVNGNSGILQDGLWISSGTSSGTLPVDNGGLGPTGIISATFTNVSGRLFFTANDSTHGFELWTSNAKPSGTQVVQDLVPGTGSSFPTELANLNGILYFQTSDSLGGIQFWALYPPNVDLNGLANSGSDTTALFIQGSGPQSIVDPTLTIKDTGVGATLEFATVTITNVQDGAAELLGADTTGTAIQAAYSNGVLSLTGTDTPDNYQQVLRSLTYDNTAVNPDNTPRVVQIVVNDGILSSQPVTSTVSLNVLPKVSQPTNVVVNENSGAGTTSIVISDVETPAYALLVSATSTDQTLLPDANITITGSNTNRTISVIPALNQTGSAQVNLTVSDGNGGVVHISFLLTVNPVSSKIVNYEAVDSENGPGPHVIVSVAAKVTPKAAPKAEPQAVSHPKAHVAPAPKPTPVAKPHNPAPAAKPTVVKVTKPATVKAAPVKTVAAKPAKHK